MNFPMKKLFLGLLFAVLTLTPVVALRAEDLGAVRARMSQRIPQIDEMKTRGVVGENNRGLLEARSGGQGAADQGVIDAENKDRETVYAAIAARTNTTADQVAKARAHAIAQSSASGVWIQDESGAWKKK